MRCIFAQPKRTDTMNISEDSKAVLQVIIDHNDNYDPCYVADIVRSLKLTPSQVKGHITDLRNKGFIAPHDPGCGELHSIR